MPNGAWRTGCACLSAAYPASRLPTQKLALHNGEVDSSKKQAEAARARATAGGVPPQSDTGELTGTRRDALMFSGSP